MLFDDDLGKLGKRIHGVEVKGTISQVQERLRAMDIQEIIVAIPSAGKTAATRFYRNCPASSGSKFLFCPVHWT